MMKNNSCDLETCVNLDLAIDYLVNVIRHFKLWASCFIQVIILQLSYINIQFSQQHHQSKCKNSIRKLVCFEFLQRLTVCLVLVIVQRCLYLTMLFPAQDMGHLKSTFLIVRASRLKKSPYFLRQVHQRGHFVFLFFLSATSTSISSRRKQMKNARLKAYGFPDHVITSFFFRCRCKKLQTFMCHLLQQEPWV